MMNNIVEVFLKKTFEDEINANLLENNYVFPKEEMMEYIHEINLTDIFEFFVYFDEHFSSIVLTVEDAIQYSNFDDATTTIAIKMIRAGDKGFSHLQIGRLLQNDGRARKDGAYTKYGENHAKTSEYLGYLFSLKRTYYVSAIGYTLADLNLCEWNKLYARLFVRTNLFKTVYYLSKSGDVDMRRVFDSNMLSEATYLRRRSNIRMLFEKLVEVEPSCKRIVSRIIY